MTRTTALLWRARKRNRTTACYLLPALLVGLVTEVGLRTVTLPSLARAFGVRLQRTRHEPEHRAIRGRLGARDAARYRAACLVLWLWPRRGEAACLRLALIAGFLLRRRQPSLRLGVAHHNGRTVAHAWLVVDGIALDPRAHHYYPLTSPGRA